MLCVCSVSCVVVVLCVSCVSYVVVVLCVCCVSYVVVVLCVCCVSYVVVVLCVSCVSYAVVVLCVCCDAMLWRCYHTAAHSGLRAVLGCGGKKWDWAENMTASLQQQWSPAPRPPSSVLSIPSPDIPANFLYLHQQQAAAHVLGQSLQPGSSIKAVCVYSPRSGGQADTEQESCGSRPLDMSTILSNCAMLCSDSSVIPTFLCPTPNIRGSCFEWHVIVILLIFQYLQSILIACYWRCPATGLCPAVQNMFLMWHILLFSYNCLAACPQCPAILHLAAIVTLCRGY